MNVKEGKMNEGIQTDLKWKKTPYNDRRIAKEKIREDVSAETVYCRLCVSDGLIVYRRIEVH